MRLDKYLKESRLIKRRTVAQEACDGGRVKVNGQSAKPSKDINAGDVLELSMGIRTIRVEVLSVESSLRKEDAVSMYKELPDKNIL